MEQDYWRRCGPCKKEIAFGSRYYLCSVSTCRKMAFCSRDCWSAHVPIMRHKDAWPEEEVAPLAPEAGEKVEARRRIVAGGAPSPAAAALAERQQEDEDLPQDILIVASKLKNYIRAKSQMNTSAQVLERLSDIVRVHCDHAILRAREDGRKTVLDRDFHL